MSDARNVGHGHVFVRPDGVKALCGGPGVCLVCSAEKARAEQPTQPLTASDHARLSGLKVGVNYKHTKSGRTYRVLSMAKLERNSALVVIYISLAAAEKFDLPWVRPVDEFVAKFKEVTA